jgi:uncharacterized protein (TIGR02145 family)
MRNKTLLFIILILTIAINSFAQETGTFTDSRDNKKYKTVIIGTQTWMAENLSYKAKDGCWSYNNDETYVEKYGYLYNWITAKDACPKGWHLPTDAEWTTLTKFVGSENIAGGILKITTIWGRPNSGATNEVGFTALPGGCRNYDKTFEKLGDYGYWWTSTDINVSNAWYRNMSYGYSSVNRSLTSKDYGYSIRCVKD